jgi:hypothetical protein
MALRIGELEDALIEAGASRERAAAAAEATAPATLAAKLDQLDDRLVKLGSDITRLATTVRVGGALIGGGVLAVLVRVYFP